MKLEAPILVLLLISSFTFSLSGINMPCNETSDCEFGYCNNGMCEYPVAEEKVIGGPCNKSADCLEGYCDLSRTCIIPLGGEDIIKIGFKNGCAGLITCPTERIECVIFCNLIWLLLVVFSIIAVYVNKDKKNRLVPITVFFLPFIVAFVSLPIAGMIVAIAELIITYYTGKEPEEAEEEEE